MNKHVALGLAVGAGVVGLIALHALLSGQSAAQSATSIGASLSAPFVAQTATNAGGLANAATVTDPQAPQATAPAAPVTTTGLPIAPTPVGVPAEGWGAALAGMNSVALGSEPGTPLVDAKTWGL